MNPVKGIILLMFLSGILLFVQPVSLSGDNDYGYAVYLYKSGDYSGAIIELKRFIYHNPENLHFN